MKRKKVFFLLSVAMLTFMPFVILAQRGQETIAWDEDRDRIEYFWRTALPPNDYMRAVEITGQLRALKEGAVFAATPWVPIGPTGDFGTGTFETTNGRIRSIHIQSIENDYYVYVGASSGGIWRAKGSTGPAWTSLGDRLPNPAVGAFAVHPNNSNDILVGTGDYNRYGGAGMLFRTTDAGQNWTKISLTVNPNAFFRIYYLPGNPNVVLAASSAGLLRSTNGPNGPWSVVLGGTISDLVIHPTNANTQYCCRATTSGNDGGVYRSTDAGQTWTLITSAYAPANEIGHSRIAVCRNVPNNLAFVYEFNGIIHGIRRSTNGGNTWTVITGDPINAGQAFHALAIAFRPTNANELYVGANELWRSLDGGITWTYLRDVERHQDQTQLYFSTVTGDDILWICNDGGLYRYSVTGVASESWNGNQTTGLQVSQIAYMDAKRDFRVAGLQDDGDVASIDAGMSWKGFYCCDGDAVAITEDLNPTNPTFWFCNGGGVIMQPFNGSGQDVGFSSSLNQLFFDRFSNKVYSVNNAPPITQVLARSADGTGTWIDEGNNVPAGIGGLNGSYLNGQTLLGWGGKVLTVLQKSGAAWTVQRSVSLSNNVQFVFASTERPGESWAGLQGSAGTPKILHTTDYWQTWTDISGTLTIVGRVFTIVATPFDAKQIFVGTDVGMFYTQDGGATWQPFQTGLPIVQCRALRYIGDRSFPRTGNDKLVVATFGRGMYERTISRPPLVYVDHRNNGFEDGTFEHPYNLFIEGHAVTPDYGILAIYGGVYSAPQTLNRPMTLQAYGSTVKIGN